MKDKKEYSTRCFACLMKATCRVANYEKGNKVQAKASTYSGLLFCLFFTLNFRVTTLCSPSGIPPIGK